LIPINKIINGDCLGVLKTMPDESIGCCVTSPPYFGLRDYLVNNQIGKEEQPDEYVEKLVLVFNEIKRVLKTDGTLWLNVGDSYAANRTYQVPSTKGGPKHSVAQGLQTNNKVPIGLKPKDLIGIPWKIAFALQKNGWFLRQDIIWQKVNQMPESVKDRCTKSHEYVFLLSKNQKYFFNSDAIKEPCHNSLETRNKRSVWSIPTKPFNGAHCAVFPEALVEPCIKAGCKEGGIVLDPFIGSGTVAVVALRLGRKFIGIELNPDSCKIAEERIKGTNVDS